MSSAQMYRCLHQARYASIVNSRVLPALNCLKNAPSVLKAYLSTNISVWRTVHSAGTNMRNLDVDRMNFLDLNFEIYSNFVFVSSK